MSTTTTDLTETTFNGFFLPGTTTSASLYAHRYDIYPSVIEETREGAVKAVQYFDPFDVYFAAPIDIRSDKDSQYVYFYCEENGATLCPEFAGYDKTSRYGVYTDEGPITIDYTVSDKGILVQNGTLNITIYLYPKQYSLS